MPTASKRASHIGTIVLAVALCGGETAAAGDAPRSLQNCIYVSWGDEIMVSSGDAALDTAEKIDRSIERWKSRHHAQLILWRTDDLTLMEYYTMRTRSGPFIEAFNQRYQEILGRFDPFKTAVASAHQHGIRILAYETIFDLGAPETEKYGGDTPFPWQDKFIQAHPDYQETDRAGNHHWGVPQLAYPEMRDYLVRRLARRVQDGGFDGLYVCTRTHSLPAKHADQFGFDAPIVRAFQNRHGVNILKEDFDRDAWRKLRGEYLVQFYRELRRALPGKTIVTGIPRGRHLGPPYGNLDLAWETLVRERLVDGLIVGVYSGKGLHPHLYVPHREIGYLSSEDDSLGIPDREFAVSDIYGPPCRAAGVALYFNNSGLGPRDLAWWERERSLTGFMIIAPGGGSGRGSIRHADELSFPEGNLTVEAFVRPRSSAAPNGANRIISKYDHTENHARRSWEILHLPDGRVEFLIFAGRPLASQDLISQGKLTVGRWTHLACVVDQSASQMRIFLDGRLDVSQSIPRGGLQVNPDQDVFIGRYGGSDIFFFDGELDELRLVSRALSFTAAPAQPYTGREGGTIALYHFDQASGLILEDSVGRHPMTLLMGGADCLVPSQPGFGQALNLTIGR